MNKDGTQKEGRESLRYAVVDWQNTNAVQSGAAFLPFTAATYREGDDWGVYPKLVRQCRTWQEAAKLANRLNLETVNRLGLCRRNPTPPGCAESFSPREEREEEVGESGTNAQEWRDV